MKKKPSIKDIAAELNVAKSTVSFVINGIAKEKRISEELTKKILDHIEKRGFRPNELARSLSTGRTNMLCLMVENISDHFFSHFAFLIEKLAYQHGYKIIYFSTQNNTEKTKDLIAAMQNLSVDGYIIVPPNGIENEIENLIQEEKPLVLFDRYLPHVQADYVMLDNHRATVESMDLLIQNNHKNIGFITLDSDQIQMQDRLKGYLDSCKMHGLTPQVLKTPFANSIDANAKYIEQFLKDNKHLDSILFATNYLAISGVKALNELNIIFPKDISIIAFDDHYVFNVYKPNITTISQPLELMAEKLFQILLAKLKKKKNIPVEQVVIPSTIKLGESILKRG